MRAISRVAIAGAGTMGYSLAQAFARFGYDVTLYDLFPAALEKAKGLIALNQSTEVDSGKLTAEDATSELSIDASKVSSDMVGMDSKKYTERNAEWDEKVVDDVLDLVNDMLGEIDKIVAEKIN